MSEYAKDFKSAIHFTSVPARCVFILTSALCFFLPFKFGDMVCVPDAASVLPLTVWEWILNNWGDAFFATVSALLLLASILFPSGDTFMNRRQFCYCGGFAAIFLLSGIGIINARGVDYPAGEMVHLGGALSFLLLTANVAGNNKAKCRVLCSALTCGWVILLLSGLYQYFWGFATMRDFLAEQEAAGIRITDELRNRLLDDRLTAGCGSSATFSGILLLLTPPGLLILWEYGRRFQPERLSQITFVALAGVTAAAEFLLARSRAAFLAITASAVITVWCKIKSLRWRIITAAAALIVISAGAWYIHTAGRGFGSMAARADYYAASAQMLAESPITGSGWGGFADNYMRLKIFDIDENARDPHSMLATLASQAGILPLAAGICWLCFLFTTLFRLTVSADKSLSIRSTVFMFALSGFWLQSQMDLHFQVTATLATALVTGFIALEAPGTGEPEIQKKKVFRLAVAVFAVAAAAVSIWWLRAEYSYMNLHDNFTKVPPATGYEVKKALDDCVAARPYSAFVYLSAGNYYASKCDFASAEKAYKQAMQINPAYYSIYAQLAKLEAARNNRKEAAGWAEECLKLNPYHKASKDIVAVFSLTNQTNGVN